MEPPYRFGPFQIDPGEREFRRDGELLSLTGKSFDLLTLLLRGAGRTLTKDELMTSLWPDTVVEESNLTQTVFMLRKALGDDPSSATYILTVPRLGYKFVAPVTRVLPEPSESTPAVNVHSRIPKWVFAAAG